MELPLKRYASLLQKVPRVLRFLGGLEPAPLSQKEIDRILSQMKGEITVGKKDEEFYLLGLKLIFKKDHLQGLLGLLKK
jgi:transcription antitermination factor NusG